MDPKTISYSEIDTYRQCRLKHQLSYAERWRTDEEAPALTRGTRFHSIMEEHYRAIQQAEIEPVDAATLYAAVAPDLLYDRETGEQTEEMALCEWIYRGYVDLYGLDPMWEVVEIERPMSEPLYHRNGDFSGFMMNGTVDLVVRDRTAGGGLWVVDHKTCKNLPKQKDFDMEDQTGIYTHLLLQSGLDIRGAIYNHCRTYRLVGDQNGSKLMTHDERFKRTRTVRTPQELATMCSEALKLMIEAYDRLERHEGLEFDAPRSPDGERCGWKCGYTEACLAGRKSGPDATRRYLLDIGFTKHDTKPGPTFNKTTPLLGAD